MKEEKVVRGEICQEGFDAIDVYVDPGDKGDLVVHEEAGEAGEAEIAKGTELVDWGPGVSGSLGANIPVTGTRVKIQFGEEVVNVDEGAGEVVGVAVGVKRVLETIHLVWDRVGDVGYGEVVRHGRGAPDKGEAAKVIPHVNLINIRGRAEEDLIQPPQQKILVVQRPNIRRNKPSAFLHSNMQSWVQVCVR